LTSNQFELLKDRKGPIYNDARITTLLGLDREGYVCLTATGWSITPKGKEYLLKYDRLLTVLEKDL